VVDAADWLRHDLNVSKPLWGEACVVMGREQAAIAIAIVSAKPAAPFSLDAGRVFPRHGGEGQGRNLQRTIWGLRQAAAPKQRRTNSREGSSLAKARTWP
jgi:replication initiation protein RepC